MASAFVTRAQEHAKQLCVIPGQDRASPITDAIDRAHASHIRPWDTLEACEKIPLEAFRSWRDVR